MWTLLISLGHAQDLPPKPPRVGLQYSIGAAGFTGDLSDDQGVLVHDWQLKTLWIRSPRRPRWQAYLGVDVLTLRATHDGSDFPYEPDQDLRVLSFLFIVHGCYEPAPVRVCAGLGEGTVNVNSATSGRDYGTWNYHLQVDYLLPWAGLSVFGVGRFVGSVEQVVQGSEASFSFWTAGAGVGWAPPRRPPE